MGLCSNCGFFPPIINGEKDMINLFFFFGFTFSYELLKMILVTTSVNMLWETFIRIR